jgi:hypothetical protein
VNCAWNAAAGALDSDFTGDNYADIDVPYDSTSTPIALTDMDADAAGQGGNDKLMKIEATAVINCGGFGCLNNKLDFTAKHTYYVEP